MAMEKKLNETHWNRNLMEEWFKKYMVTLWSHDGSMLWPHQVLV